METSQRVRSGPPDAAAWRDWRWQLRHRILSLSALKQRLPALEISRRMEEAAGAFPFAVTPYYASLIGKPRRGDPVFAMAVPDADELVDQPFLADDPLGEENAMPVPGLIRRYRDRAVLLASASCAVCCRHCMRKRRVGRDRGAEAAAGRSAPRLARVTAYLGRHPEIREVIVSGGDPLTLSTPELEGVLRALRAVASVEVIRIGTRAPAVLPMRVTDALTEMLARYHPLFMNLHFNHPVELTAAARAACERLADAGIPLGNQTVLLRGVNDDAALLAELFRGLLRMRVRPYYLFQCDLVRGVEHFRTPLARGLEIMAALHDGLSGMAVPRFAVDAPQAGGKVALSPNRIVRSEPGCTVLSKGGGRSMRYPEPAAPDRALDGEGGF